MLHRTLITGILLAAGAFAQMSSFPKPSYFRETFQKTRTKVELRDPVKLKDFVVDGKLELSLRHYLELVMANNTDVQIQMLTIEQPKNAILSAMGVWDPRATASFSTTRNTNIPTDPVSAQNAGAGALVKNLTQPFRLTVTQQNDFGGSYNVVFNGTKSSSSNSRSTYNPNLSSNMQFSFTQNLIQGRGRYVNRIPVMTAQSNLKISEFNLRSQLLNLVNNAENAYWSVISARESLTVAEKARDTAAAFLKYMQQQLDLGAISRLDIFSPQSQLASQEVNVAQAKFNLLQAEDTLRRQIGADLDPAIRQLPISLTEPVDLGPSESMPVDREETVLKALANNPAMKSTLQRLDVDDLSIQSAKNGLLPNLQFNASYQTKGQGGIFYPSQSSLFGAAPLEPIPGGLGDALSQMFGFGYPTYQAGLTLTLPIRSKTASAAMANALVQKKQDSLAVRNQQQSIRLNILNAVTALEGAKEQLKLARTSLDFANKNLEAENQKFELGTDIAQNVITAQRDVTAAQGAVVSQQINVRRNLLNLLTQTGELLDQRGIVVK
jgi:outer membrane protein